MKKSLISLSLLAALSFNASVQAEEASDWSFKLTPYGFANSISGTATVFGQDAPADLDFEQIFNNLDATFMMTGEAVHKSGWGFSVDYSFMDLSKDLPNPIGSAGVLSASNRLGVLEGLAFKRTETKFGQVDVFGGFRWWDHDLAAQLNIGPATPFDVSVSEDWVDAVVGVRLLKELNEDWAISARADVGGLGLSSDFTSTVMAGVNYKLTDMMTLEVSYKATWVDYNNGKDGADYYAYDTLTRGPVVGLSFQF